MIFETTMLAKHIIMNSRYIAAIYITLLDTEPQLQWYNFAFTNDTPNLAL